MEMSVVLPYNNPVKVITENILSHCQWRHREILSILIWEPSPIIIIELC